MKCIEIQDNLVEFLLAELDESSARDVEDHLRGNCAHCQREFALISEGVDLLFEFAPGTEASAERVARILAAATAHTPHGSSLLRRTDKIRVADTPISASRLCTWFIGLTSLAAGFLLAASLFPAARLSEQRLLSHPGQPTTPPGSPSRVNVDSFGAVLDVQRQLRLPKERFRTTFVSSPLANQRPRFQGVVVFDQLSREIHFFGSAFPTPPLGTDYVLWVGGGEMRPLPIVTLSVSADGATQAVAELPEGGYTGIFITLEQSGERPTEPSNSRQLVLES